MFSEQDERKNVTRVQSRWPSVTQESTERQHSDADTQCDDDEIRLGVVAVLKRVIPLVEYLNHWCANADRQENGHK